MRGGEFTVGFRNSEKKLKDTILSIKNSCAMIGKYHIQYRRFNIVHVESIGI